MSVLFNNNVGMGAAAAAGNDIANSLRFRGNTFGYLQRTPGSSGNRKTFTISFWGKRATLGTEQHIFGAGWSGSGYHDTLRFWASSYPDAFHFYLIIS